MFRLKFSTFFYIIGAVIVAFTVLSHLQDEFVFIADLMLFVFMGIVVFDIFLLFFNGNVKCTRIVPDRMSNGDFNEIELHVTNEYRFPLLIEVIDELPYQFQITDYSLFLDIKEGETKHVTYEVKPVERGEYVFENINIFVKTSLNLAVRKFELDAKQTVPVYPSFIQMHEYEIMAFADTQKREGIKRIRRIGQSREFEQVKHYVQGDDIRFINWNATARKSELMVNQYMDEISQNIYTAIDMGRNMLMPFNGMTLLDYAINATLASSNVIIKKYDRAGLFTFSNQMGTFLKADSQLSQIRKIAEHLYHQKTQFLESNFELLFQNARSAIKGRSLIILYTNFEGISSMRRQLKYLKAVNRLHVLLVVFFENTELFEMVDEQPKSLEEVYTKTVGMQFIMEKKQIVKELNQHGIQTLLTDPQHLTINTINKYLELKHRGMI